jgi:hypothetical protein
MTEAELESILVTCERAVASGDQVHLGPLGFWKAVAAVKRHPEWVERYAGRIAAVDQQAFEQGVKLRVPHRLGVAALALGSTVGVSSVVASLLVRRPQKDMLAVTGAGILLVATHDLAHFIVGRTLGVRFTNVFLGGKLRLAPGLKIDYGSYLRIPPVQRAWMHASGAMTTEAVATLVFLLAVVGDFSRWVTWMLGAVAAAVTLTEVFFSTRYSDWRRFRREMHVASALEKTRNRSHTIEHETG